MFAKFEDAFIGLVQERDLTERFGFMAKHVSDSAKLSKQVIALRAALADYGSGAATTLDINELTNTNHQLEVKLQERIEQSTQLSEQNISLRNQLQDTKEMLFQAETSLHDLNKKFIDANERAEQGEVFAR